MTRQPFCPSTAAGYDPDVVQEAQIAVTLAARREGQQASVRGPGWLGVVPVAVGDLTRFAARGVDDEQVFVHRFIKAFAVAFVADAGDDPYPRRLAFLVGLAFLTGDLFDIDPSAEG